MAKDIGSLFYGTGALDLAVQNTWGGEVAWYAENDRNVSRIGSWHNPDVQNLGDVTRIDWTKVEPVRVLTGGSPCQDLSHAGKRLGMNEGTRSNLWVQMREAVAVLRPELVVWENVRGSYSAPAYSTLEHCPRCVGSRRTVRLRALGRVLGDMADLGYDCRWHGLSASEVGAPHGRYRVFLLAYPSGTTPPDPLDQGQNDRSAGQERRADPDLGVRQGQLLRRGHWGRYMPAVLRWERLTRPSPSPLMFNEQLGLDQLTPQFAEWMMGLPQGWVTGVPGLQRKPALRALGNSVVPQQAEVAFRLMCNWSAYDQSRR